MPKDPSREAHFPAIEKRYGEKMSYWFKVMKEIKDEKYPAQIAHLRQNYGFSQAHANALVMYSRGSTSAKRFETPAQYYKTINPKQATTIRNRLAHLTLNKKTIGVPNDWKVEEKLILALVKARLAEVK